MTVFTRVVDACNAINLPLMVVIAALPAVETEIPAEEMTVPTKVSPPAALIVAALPTCQKTFAAWAPLIRITLRGAPARPTVSEVPIWKTQTALALPWASSVRSDPDIAYAPEA